MVGTKHCCWGECKSDSRYPEKLDESLKAMLELGQKAFLPFIKPSIDFERCQRWIDSCSREGFTIKNINKSTYICALHWPGKKGPTQECPDPLKAKLTRHQVKEIRAKRKARNCVVKNHKRLKIPDDQESLNRQKEEKNDIPFVSDSNQETLTEFTKYEELSSDKVKSNSNSNYVPIPQYARKVPVQKETTHTILQNEAKSVTVHTAPNVVSSSSQNSFLLKELLPRFKTTPPKPRVPVQKDLPNLSTTSYLKVFPFMGKENKETQTELANSEVSVESCTAQNKAKVPRNEIQIVSNTSLEVVSKSSSHMQHFTGLSSENFELLYNFVNGISPLSKITYCGLKGKADTVKRQLSTWSYKELLYMSLLGLRNAWSFKTMSILLSTPDRKISEWLLRNIFITYIQLISKIFKEKEYAVFPSKETLSRCLPKVFKSTPRVCCSVYCAEFKVEMQSSNNVRQRIPCEHDNIHKSLIALTPSGGACFVSDLLKGEITEEELFKESGVLKQIKPCDLLLVDRGVTALHFLNPLQAQVSDQTNPSAAEELSTRKISKARVNAEKFRHRLREFQLICNTIPQSLAPLATEMVVVACGLINFQHLLCK